MSETRGALDADLFVGRWATALQPRGLHAPSASGGGVRIDEVAFAVRADGSGELRELLDRLGGATQVARSPRGALEVVVRCPRADWDALARGSVAADTLRAASDATRSSPGPVQVMGIVNVTPDSFSDGGRFFDRDRAIEHGLALAAEGADILDIGGESTRPGAAPVAVAEELARVVPVVAALARAAPVPISIDTTKAEVARAALDAGAVIVNDVSAGRFDPALLELVAQTSAGYVAMHMQGTPRDMQTSPDYDDVVADVLQFMRERVRACLAAGIARERIWIDPGIGFGKQLEHNVEILRRLAELRSLGLPVCLGVSRKSFLAKLTGRDGSDRRAATAAAVAIGVVGGAEIVRVHEPAAMREAAAVAMALRR